MSQPRRQTNLFRPALPRDQPAKARCHNACRFAKLHGFDVTGRDQFIKLGSTDANHMIGFIDLDAFHGAATSLR